MVGGGKEPTLEAAATKQSIVVMVTMIGSRWMKKKNKKKTRKMSELDMMLHNLGYRITQGGTEG